MHLVDSGLPNQGKQGILLHWPCGGPVEGSIRGDQPTDQICNCVPQRPPQLLVR